MRSDPFLAHVDIDQGGVDGSGSVFGGVRRLELLFGLNVADHDLLKRGLLHPEGAGDLGQVFRKPVPVLAFLIHESVDHGDKFAPGNRPVGVMLLPPETQNRYTGYGLAVKNRFKLRMKY